MRILYFSRDWTTHDERFLRTMVAGGHETWLLRWENAGRPLPEHELPTGVREALWTEASLSGFRAVVDCVRPELVHAGPVHTCGYLAALSDFHPFVLMSWGSDILWDAVRDPESRERARVALAAADWLVCDCREVGRRAAEIAEFPVERTVTFPWGIDLERFEKSGSALPVRQSPGWEAAAVVLSLRSWEPMYGVNVAIDAFALAARTAPLVRLVLGGDGSEADTVKASLLSRGLMSRTHLPGRIPQSELPGYYHAADVYLSCSYCDGSSVSLIEALAAGLPVVATDIPGNREWIEPEVNGWLCPAGDTYTFARALTAALNLTADRRSEIAERNRALARRRADWRLHAVTLDQTYQKAAAGPRYGTRTSHASSNTPASDSQVTPWLADRHLAYHRRQFAEPYRSTVHLRRFVERILGARSESACSALDAGCGAGANIFHLSQVLTEARWTGVDIAAHLFEAHRALAREHGGLRNPVSLIEGDFYHLPRLLAPRSFDLAFSIQTVSWLDGYSGFLPQFLAMLKPGGVAFLTSLFTDFHVDARIQITEYEENGSPRAPMFYNIYAWNRFRESCLELGAAEVTAENFEIDTELPPPAHLHMGTYTERLAGGRLLQRSGPLLMPWKAIAIRMPEER